MPERPAEEVRRQVLAELYHGPAALEELARHGRHPLSALSSLVDRLTKEDLVRPIQKTDTRPIFALTRKGERLLERLTLQRIAVLA